MTNLVRSELKKITSTRLWWGLLLGAVLFTAIQAGATAAFTGAEAGPGQPETPAVDTPEAIRSVYALSVFSGSYIFALILGITGMTTEYRYQTITPTFLVSPGRSRVVVAKMFAHLVVGAGYALVSLVAALAVGATVLGLRGEDLGFAADRLWSTIGLAVAAVAIWTLLGIGIGTLVRNQVAAILLAILITFLIEPLLTVLFGALDMDAVVKYLPTNASTALMSPGEVLITYLDWWVGGLVLLGYAVLLAGLGVLVSVRRDVT